MPRNGIRATLMLVDHVTVAEGKLYINGGGWTVIGPNPHPYGIALDIEIPWDRSNIKHRIALDLLDADGKPVTVHTDEEQISPIRWEHEMEVGRPPGMKPGTPLNAPVGVNFGPMPIPPGQQYVWQLTIDGHSDEDWRLMFTTRPLPPQAMAA